MTVSTVLHLTQEELRHVVEAAIPRTIAFADSKIQEIEFYDLDDSNADPDTRTGAATNLAVRVYLTREEPI